MDIILVDVDGTYNGQPVVNTIADRELHCPQISRWQCLDIFLYIYSIKYVVGSDNCAQLFYHFIFKKWTNKTQNWFI